MRNCDQATLRVMGLLLAGLLYSAHLSGKEPVRMLILSGQNNHEWQKTTPALEKIYRESGSFSVSVTNRPDTLKLTDYKKYRVILSNWNNWPDTSTRWDAAREDAFVRYVREGGGAIFYHAGGCSFYGWSDYFAISIGRWGSKTEHGQIGPAKVHCSNTKHPITKGLKDFTLADEIWVNTEISPSATELGWVQKIDADGKETNEKIPAIFANTLGAGRSFYTILGHDEKILANAGLQELLIRAARWAGRVTLTSKQ